MRFNINNLIDGYSVDHVYYRIAFFFIVFLFVFSFAARWKMTETRPLQVDEIYDMQTACQFSKGESIYTETGYYFRTPLIAHFGSTFCQGDDSLLPVMKARKFMWAFSLAIMVLVYLIAQRVYGPGIAIFAPLTLCSFTTFMDHSLYVRPDLVGTLLCCGALFLATYNSRCLYLLAGTLLGLAAMTTQKSLYPILAFIFSLIVRHVLASESFQQSKRAVFRSLGFSAIGFGLLLTAYIGSMFSNENIPRFFHQILFDAADAGLFSHVYRWTWNFFTLTIQRNPVVWGLGLSGMLWALIGGLQGKKEPAESKRKYSLLAMIGVWGIIQFIFTLKHDVKFPYYFINISPILSICAAGLFASIFHAVFSTKSQSIPLSLGIRGMYIVLVIFSLLKFPYERHVHNLTTGNLHHQQAVVARLDSITDPNDAIFDGVGLATTRKKATPYSLTSRFFSRKLRNDYNLNIIDWLRKTEPIAFVDSYRFNKLSEQERSFLSRHFLHDWANIWVAGVTIPADGAERTTEVIDLITSASYSILCDDPSTVTIDGTPVDNTVYLNAGEHVLSFAGPNDSVTLKYSLAVQNPPPFPRKRSYKLFMGFSQL